MNPDVTTQIIDQFGALVKESFAGRNKIALLYCAADFGSCFGIRLLRRLALIDPSSSLVGLGKRTVHGLRHSYASAVINTELICTKKVCILGAITQ